MSKYAKVYNALKSMYTQLLIQYVAKQVNVQQIKLMHQEQQLHAANRSHVDKIHMCTSLKRSIVQLNLKD